MEATCCIHERWDLVAHCQAISLLVIGLTQLCKKSTCLGPRRSATLIHYLGQFPWEISFIKTLCGLEIYVVDSWRRTQWMCENSVKIFFSENLIRPRPRAFSDPSHLWLQVGSLSLPRQQVLVTNTVNHAFPPLPRRLLWCCCLRGHCTLSLYLSSSNPVEKCPSKYRMV